MAAKTLATYISELSAVSSLGAGDKIPLLEAGGMVYVEGDDLGGGITALTGEVTASGTGSVAATIANGAVTNVKVAAGIDAVKIADGTVTNAEFQYLGGVTSDIQTQLNAKQASDADLTTIAGLTPTNDDVMQYKSGAWANRTLAQLKTDLSLQPLDATLTAFAGLTIAADSLTIGTGVDAFSQTTFAANTFPAKASTGNLVAKPITDFGLSLVDDTDASAARTTLGLGTLATQSGTFSGTSSGTNTGDQTDVSGNAGTVTVADAGGDTTTWVLLGTSQTGNLSPATDAGLTYNATTNALSATTFVGALTGNADTVTGFSGSSSGTNTGDQTIANSSDATSHTVTLSASGGSVQLVEGSGITLTTTGSASAGIVTIAASGGGDISNGGNTTGAALTIGTNDDFGLNLETSGVTRMAISGGTGVGGQVTITNVTANTNTVSDALTIQTNSTGTAAASFGGGILFQGESSTTDNRDMVRLSAIWTTATDASRASALVYSDVTAAGALTERFRFTPSAMTTATAYTVGNSSSALTLGGSTGTVTIQGTSSTAGAVIVLNASSNGATSTGNIVIGAATAYTQTSGTRNYLNHNAGFAPTSGTAEHNSFVLNGTFNQTGGANGITRSIYLNPTLTAVADFRGLEIAYSSATAKGIYQTGALTTNNFAGPVNIGSTNAPVASTPLTIEYSTANTATVQDMIVLRTNSTGTAAASFGGGILFQGESSTTDNRDMVRLSAIWTTATDASRASALVYSDVTAAGAIAERFRFTPSAMTTATAYTVGNSSSALTLGGSTGTVAITSSANSATAVAATMSGGSGGFTINASSSSRTTTIPVVTLQSTSLTGTSGNVVVLEHSGGYSPASGTGTYKAVSITPTINQTGGANGNTWGININPTLTAVGGTYYAIDIGANSASAKGVYQSGATTTNNFVGNTTFGATTAPTAKIMLAAGTAAANTAPLKFTSGTNLTAAEAGAVEYNGSNLFYTNGTPARRTIANLEDNQTFSGTLTPSNRLMLPMGEISYFSTTGTAITISGTSDGSTNMVLVNPAVSLNNDMEFDSPSNGRLRYTGTTTKTFHVACTFSGSPATVNDEFVFGVAKGGTVIAASKVLQKFGAVTDAQFGAIHVMVSLATNEYLELYVGNITETANFTIKTLNLFAMGM